MESTNFINPQSLVAPLLCSYITASGLQVYKVHSVSFVYMCIYPTYVHTVFTENSIDDMKDILRRNEGRYLRTYTGCCIAAGELHEG